ncbi:MAG: AAA family ATPase [Trichodesmium sp. MAG_R03]|nr:AAA family ATPase [Trichodesmium sp. MAG_R03]
MFRNLKKFLEVALENLQGGESINIKQSIAENATSDRGITINNPTQIVNVPDEESKLKNILLDSIETDIEQLLTLLKERRINLLKENRYDLVIGNKPPSMRPKKYGTFLETPIIDIFNSYEIGHKLLITGEAGSGKTTTMIELAEALINQAKQDKNKPVPVLFKLSYWKDSSIPFFDWLLEQLKRVHGIKNELGRKLINGRQIIPLVDEFDEVNPKLLDSCFEEINKFLETSTISFVICCRLNSYEFGNYKLKLNGAICLQPLTEIQIEEYLQKIEKIENKNYKDFFNDIKNNAIIKEISKNPLFFSLFLSHSAYRRIPTRKFKPINYGWTEQILDILYDLHIDSRRKSEKGYRYKFDKTKLKQLAWLARKMQKNYMTEFCIEELQPTWLENNNGQQIIYRIGITLIFIVLFCFVFWQIGYEKYQLVIAIILGVVFGLTIGVRGGLSPRIEITESFIQKGVRYNELAGFIFGGIGGILGIVVDWLYDGLVDGVTLALTGFLIGALFGGIANSDIAEIGDKQIPNQGIKDSALNAMVFTLVYGFIGALIFGSICWAINGWNDAFDCAQSAAISFGLCAGMVNGGNTCIQHYILRLVLYRSGIIRWNINHFLEQSASLMFLQRVGGRYSFIHSELRNYFARRFY